MFCMPAYGHQFTPTYPVPLPSHIKDVVRVRMELFNSRKEIQYYEFNVYDGDWNPVPFATAEKIVRLPYLDRKNVDFYLRKKDPAVYICSTSKIIRSTNASTVISSKICSKLK